MKNRFNNYIYLLIGFSLLYFSGCKNEDNPSEPIVPVESISDNLFLYDGNIYSPDSLKSWGLGNVQKDYFHNDKDFDWYIDQANTGSASGNNCGPSSVTMAIKWFDKTFSKTAEDARNTYPMNGGWWYTNNIIDYLNYYSVTNSTVSFTGIEQLENVIKDGNIAILCISTEYIRYNNKKSDRVDRFYSYASGHFLVVKGIRKVDEETYIEVYDSNTWNEKYSDGLPKGKNRHYRASDISNAIKNWWNYIIVVSKNKLTKRFYSNLEDPANIKHMWGM